MMRKIQILDCTLRDGGYINDWEFGHNNLLSIYQRLVESNMDIVEVGFIDDRRPFDINRSIFPNTASIQKIYDSLPKKAPMTVAMIDYGTCGIKNIQPCSESWIDGIRVIFKKHLMREALEYCAQLKNLGYKVFSQLVSITSYNDEELLQLVEIVNKVAPYAVSMVDTYGLLTPMDLLHYYRILDEKINPQIQIGFHSHNNMQLAFANVIAFLQRETDRNIVVDGTLYGMGKSAGNAPLELVANYMNDRYGGNYKIDHILEAIEESVLDIYNKFPWNYKIFFYLSAKNKCHPNYVSYFQSKSNLSVSDLDKLLEEIQPEENRLLYKKNVAVQSYDRYLLNISDDSADLKKLKDLLNMKKILIIGPGKNIVLQNEKVLNFIKSENPFCISINYIPQNISPDALFLTNSRRYLQMTEKMLSSDFINLKILATSNVTPKFKNFDFVVNREPLLERDQAIIDNSFLMLLKVFRKIDVRKIFCAGLDGYSDREDNYFNSEMEYSFVKKEALRMNRHISEVITDMKKYIDIEFVTYSHYEEKEDAE